MNQSEKRKFRQGVQNSLQFRINLLFIMLMAALAVTIVLIIQTIGKSLIIDENYKFIEQKGRNIVAQLSQRITHAEAMAKSLSIIAERLPRDEQAFKQVVPELLYRKESRIRVAGGGIWPEPFSFDKNKERRSFFWGQDKRGLVTYFDNYNDPEGPGYHFEEWYIPAKHLMPNQTYWSKSYIDPYSGEPMVTCTAPYYLNNEFSGVSTIDLKLDDLKKLLEKEAQALNGYIFAVDRSNKFLSFPDTTVVKISSAATAESNIKKMISVTDLAEKEPQFQLIAKKLDNINQDTLNINLAINDPGFEVARKIAGESYQIGLEEAKLIAATLPTNNYEPTLRKYSHILIKNDFLLNEPSVAFIFLIPQTHWKIVLISPVNQVAQVADFITQRIFIFSSFGILVCVFIAYLYIRSVFVQPLNQMTKELIKATQGEGEGLIHQSGNQRNELSTLAYWFNRRTEELKESNEKLYREIISHKESQQALEESEKRLSDHLQNTPIGAVSWDLDFQVTEWNPSAERIFGFSKDEAIGKHAVELILPQDLSDSVSSVFEALTSGQGGERNTNENITKDGRRIICDWYNTPLTDREGRTIGVASLVNDITERKKTQELMVQSEKMMSIGGLAAGMAHEINNPLAGMIQNAQVIHNRLTQKLPANLKVAEDLGISMETIDKFMKQRGILDQLERIRTGGKRAAKIIDNMLSFSKKGGAERTETDLASLIEDTLELAENDYSLKKKFDFKSIQIVKQFHPDVPPVYCERTTIQQVIFNILKNASEAMYENEDKTKNKRISITLLKQSAKVCIEIKDNGPGIDSPTRKRVFEPFFTTKSTDKGTGLGLSVSYFIIVDNHGGEMEVESTQGEGTTFIIKLPFRT